jgi:hypothetical protein
VADGGVPFGQKKANTVGDINLALLTRRRLRARAREEEEEEEEVLAFFSLFLSLSLSLLSRREERKHRER